MPTYSYKCPSCGAERDVFHKMNLSKDELPTCDLCDTLLEKQVTAPQGFQLKGGGYYVTDFKNNP